MAFLVAPDYFIPAHYAAALREHGESIPRNPFGRKATNPGIFYSLVQIWNIVQHIFTIFEDYRYKI